MKDSNIRTCRLSNVHKYPFVVDRPQTVTSAIALTPYIGPGGPSFDASWKKT